MSLASRKAEIQFWLLIRMSKGIGMVVDGLLWLTTALLALRGWVFRRADAAHKELLFQVRGRR